MSVRKIGIVAFSNMRYCPYYKFYSHIIENSNNLDYEIIYCNRFPRLGECSDEKHIPVRWLCGEGNSAPKIKKLKAFYSFALDVKKILRAKNYDRIIVLTTVPSVLLLGTLLRKYKGRYIVDIRDYTNEGRSLFRWLERIAVRNSVCNVISSPGFANFLPTAEYNICHNMSDSLLKQEMRSCSLKKAGTIIISYIGSITYVGQCKKLINLIVSDDRFEFHFYGNEINGTEISDYVKHINCNRIRMYGPFLPEDKERIYSDSDLVFNCYGNDSELLRYALSNKLYDGAAYGKPLIVSPNTSMKEVSGKYAYALDLENDDSLDGLYSWYKSLEPNGYDEFRRKLLIESAEENKKTEERIVKALNGGR